MPLDKTIHILIVDDHATMRKVLINVLRSEGFTNVTEANDGDTALKILRGQNPEEKRIQLVLLDWNMPNVQGIDVLTAIRSDPKLKDLFVIMITAESQKDNIIAAVTAGANSYVVKPFEASVILEKIIKLFSS